MITYYLLVHITGSCPPFQIPTSQMLVEGRGGSTLRFVINVII